MAKQAAGAAIEDAGQQGRGEEEPVVGVTPEGGKESTIEDGQDLAVA